MTGFDRTLRVVAVTAIWLFGSPMPTLAQAGQGERGLSWDTFATVRAVADPQLSPDGSSVLYTVRIVDVGANRRIPTTYLVDVNGGEPRAWPADTVRASEARWSPDGATVAYIAGGQLWVAERDGSKARRLTNLHGGASGPIWSPTGDRLAFVSSVHPDCSDDRCNARRDSLKEASKVKARVVDQLMYRHWSSWDEGTRSHLFVVAPDGTGLRDVTAGARYDVPPPPFGGSEGYSFSPDGRELAYSAKDAGREEAWSTDVNVYTLALAGGTPAAVTADNKAADQNPVYSPDGRFIAYAAQSRAGFESDRWRMMLYDRRTGRSRELLPSWDRNAESYFFNPARRELYIGSGDRGRDRLFRVSLDTGYRASSVPLPLIERNNNLGFTISRDGRTLAWLRDAADTPAEVWIRTEPSTSRHPSGSPMLERQLTRENASLVAKLDLKPAEDFWFRGAQGDSIHGFIIKPPGFDATRKYPVVFLIHGGPQGAWLDSWSSRWNYQLFAGIGAAVIAINPRGSTGYGQRMTDEVSGDWGGRVYEDLMKGLDAALERNAWLDSTRMSAAGGSFGGYMVNWILGHTNRFKALVSHAGIYNLEHMYGATEELWFSEWEMGGPFWNREAMERTYRRWSPHLFAERFSTPTLVVHGEQDFRVPYYESVALFSTLQRRGVPSRMVLYPDEGHWILKPQNSRLWYQEVLGWIRRHASDKVRS